MFFYIYADIWRNKSSLLALVGPCFPVVTSSERVSFTAARYKEEGVRPKTICCRKRLSDMTSKQGGCCGVDHSKWRKLIRDIA